MSQVFHGAVVNGQIEWADPTGLIKHMRLLEGARVVVTIDPLRGLDHNSCYWKLIEKTASHTGDTPKRIHDIWKRAFLIAGPDGKYTTKNLSKEQFLDYLTRCTACAVEFGVDVSDQSRAA